MALSPDNTAAQNTGYMSLPDTSAAEAALRARLSRKRTKTGCLTCRKRRIKCGEERPVCRNCIKSKRSCEGYNQRVVFRPFFDYHAIANGGPHVAVHQAGPPDGSDQQWPPEYNQHAFSPLFTQYPLPTDGQPFGQHNHFLEAVRQPGQYIHGQHVPIVPPPHPQYAGPPQSREYQPGHAAHNGYPIPLSLSQAEPQQWAFMDPAGLSAYPQPAAFTPASHSHMRVPPQISPVVSYEPQTEFQPAFVSHAPYQVSPTSSSSSHTIQNSYPPTVGNHTPPWSASAHLPRLEPLQPVDQQTLQQPAQQVQEQKYDPAGLERTRQRERGTRRDTATELYEYETHAPSIMTPTQFLQEAAVETVDNDYYDVQSGDDAADGRAVIALPDSYHHGAFQQIIAANKINILDPQTRRYDTFIYPGIIEKYQPDEHANPLKNEATARLFLHFIAVTGPSLSIYERQVRNTSMLFTNRDVQFSQQGLWTYTMPLAALRNRGLLHAMLALASLHVARLTNASNTPSLQHYAWAIKRVHQNVANEKERYKLTTIAASMLLGFYEILTADHVKWNRHLSGCSKLFAETDFCTMAKQFTRMKAERAARRRGKRKMSTVAQAHTQDEILDQIHDVDERFVSVISGHEVKYGAHGQIFTASAKIPQELDLSKFEILRDLYWWYLKQDAYQSIISGTPLLLDYHRWTDCPPRAPLGNKDAVYGSFDHLVLLLGRIADFAARDRHRKLRVMEANGGQYRPPHAMGRTGPPPGAPPTPVSATNPQQPMVNGSAGPQGPSSDAPAGPQFYGMAPPPRENVQMPASYNNFAQAPTPAPSIQEDSMDLQTATKLAHEEYGRISATLHQFSSSLGEGFQPLPPDSQMVLETPFGPALFYRSFDIGCLWAIYRMTMIIAIRSHPDMHPASHVAAGLKAQETAFFAQEIGRIAAGIVPGPADLPLNPSLGAALCESCVPSFFAAIQYQEYDQRYHTVMRIKSIAQRTGWGTAELIAAGCETAWVKAYNAGRGAPWTRIVREDRKPNADPRMTGSWEHQQQVNVPLDRLEESDRRLVKTRANNARLNWAIGVMGTEDDETINQ